MIYKILIITLLSLLLTACNNNSDNISKNNSVGNEQYARLGYENNDEPNEIIIQGNSPNSQSGNNITNDSEEPRDYIADDFNNDENLEQNRSYNNKYLSTFTTPILTKDANRYHNITIVRDRLNGYVLRNNEVFSYNKVCGPYGADDGFKEATILLSNGKEDKGYGGGVCQLSTTLYNAVKNLNVEMVERHHHSIPVAYVKNNEDATVSLQSDLDFKFKNNTGKDLKFEVKSTEKSLTVSVYDNNYNS